MFRELISRLASDYRVIAPDLPGFGFTEVPEGREYTYSFERPVATLNAFTQAVKIKRYALYVFDYGGIADVRYSRTASGNQWMVFHRICRNTGVKTIRQKHGGSVVRPSTCVQFVSEPRLGL
jgi:pimeloyl-ACP methyl ester carboxylesterase